MYCVVDQLLKIYGDDPVFWSCFAVGALSVATGGGIFLAIAGKIEGLMNAIKMALLSTPLRLGECFK